MRRRRRCCGCCGCDAWAGHVRVPAGPSAACNFCARPKSSSPNHPRITLYHSHYRCHHCRPGLHPGLGGQLRARRRQGRRGGGGARAAAPAACQRRRGAVSHQGGCLGAPQAAGMDGCPGRRLRSRLRHWGGRAGGWRAGPACQDGRSSEALNPPCKRPLPLPRAGGAQEHAAHQRPGRGGHAAAQAGAAPGHAAGRGAGAAGGREAGWEQEAGALRGRAALRLHAGAQSAAGGRTARRRLTSFAAVAQLGLHEPEPSCRACPSSPVTTAPRPQYVALRNISLIIQAQPSILANDVKVRGGAGQGRGLRVDGCWVGAGGRLCARSTTRRLQCRRRPRPATSPPSPPLLRRHLAPSQCPPSRSPSASTATPADRPALSSAPIFCAGLLLQVQRPQLRQDGEAGHHDAPGLGAQHRPGVVGGALPRAAARAAAGCAGR